MHNPFTYVAIPCEDFQRALAFYEAVTGGRVRVNAAAPFPMAYFTGDDGRDVGHLFKLPNFRVSADGPIVYMDVHPDLTDTLRIIERNGGSVVLPKTLVGPGKGYWALFLDTEGNRLALHGNS